MVSQAADRGDRLAREVLLTAARYLGMGIGNILSVVNPERIILGGGVTKAGQAYWAQVRRAARAYSVPGVSVDIVPTALGDDAPLWGAIALADLCIMDYDGSPRRW
jgi:glucokinase